VAPERRDLFTLMEQSFQPLEFVSFLKKKIDYISQVPAFKQYASSLLRVGIIKTHFNK
jgi:hypothetical protein